MLSTIDDVVRRLVEGYDPDRIILFGSHAAGRAAANSDVDLLIVKDTDKRPIDRQVEVERLLADRRLALDLVVYTPREIWDLYMLGSPFVEEVVQTGRVLYMRKATAAGLAEAQEEWETASILLENGKHRGACLHSQQCVERGLKALILEKGRPLVRTHDIADLLDRAAAEGWTVTLTADDAAFLNSVYRGRYPTEEGLLPHGEPTRDDAARALRVGEAVLQDVRAALGTAADG